MGTIFKSVGILSFLTAAAPAVLGANSVEVNVELSPAGSFQATTGALTVNGSATRRGDAFELQEVVVDLTTLQTGIGLRDQHLKEKYLETQKYPKAVLLKAKGENGKFEGELKLREVVKPIAGQYRFDGETLKATFKMKTSDYQVAKASYLGVGAEDEVEITAKVDMPAAPAAPGK